MRRTNAAILKDMVDKIAGDVLDSVFDCLKDGGVPIGLKLKRTIMDAVEKKLESLPETQEKDDGKVTA